MIQVMVISSTSISSSYSISPPHPSPPPYLVPFLPSPFFLLILLILSGPSYSSIFSSCSSSTSSPISNLTFLSSPSSSPSLSYPKHPFAQSITTMTSQGHTQWYITRIRSTRMRTRLITWPINFLLYC